MTRFLFCLLVVLTVSCGKKESNSSSVFFAGEIVNPTNDKVILFRGDEPLDTAYLDQFNRFAIELDSVVEGLHHFQHHPEEQYVYLEKGDSIQLRLNTINFDESLVFSGSGEEINNFMVEMFLADEAEERLVYHLYKLEPATFAAKIDSLRNTKLESLQNLFDEYSISQGAYDMAKAGIEYGTYIYMEAYPFYHRKKTGEKIFHKLPANFYDYRQDINFNYKGLAYLRPYYNFMKYHLGNMSYMGCMEKCGDIELESNQLHFNKHKLFLIDSLVQEIELRDNLFRNVAMDYLLKHDNEENIGRFISDFHKLSGNNRHIGEINDLYEGIKRMQPSKELPELTLYSSDESPVSLSELSRGQETVFYFWSGSEMGHFRNISKRIAKLKSKYPRYNFIGINLRTDINRWKSLIENHNLSPSEQYWADDFDAITHTLIISDSNKGIIAKDGVIIDGFANVYQSF
ncbi:TlpA family protein disulfide reductase [Lentiprolixibacter aurantiacus]|uniref:Transaldolase n=1 Tax=Lentiprolixibacter aurantiacus TaxID=2993939 RepID=A0AAE3ML42_9FLAO|nr:transaldolase [Lentiprolixibacter aurantiacus]MCX2719418.1 transaldolase [Lentiprolixibacter aurantiacus]